MLAEQNKNFFKQEVVMQQKACHKWLNQGDLNTKFSHSVGNWRSARNRLNGVFVNGQWCDNKKVIKDKVKEIFKYRFDKNEGVPVRLGNVNFNSISGEDNCMLIGMFF